MIRKLCFFIGVAVSASALIAGSASALIPENQPLWLTQGNPMSLDQPSHPQSAVAEDPPQTAAIPAQPVAYTVLAGDNLTRIAAMQSTSWLRIWNKNTALSNPDLIYPGQVFLIPDAAEQLIDRPVPAAVVAALAPQAAKRGPTAGNTYTPGYCTWYVKNRRPDLPNGLGDANTWYSRAAAQGFTVGSEPRAGAVGTTTSGEEGHVVFVERVNGDGTILISEMNYAGLYSQRTRTASAGGFSYIY